MSLAQYPKELSDHYAHKSLLEASRADTGRALGLAASEANVTTGSPTPTPRTNQDDSPSAVTQRDPIEEVWQLMQGHNRQRICCVEGSNMKLCC